MTNYARVVGAAVLAVLVAPSSEATTATAAHDFTNRVRNGQDRSGRRSILRWDSARRLHLDGLKEGTMRKVCVALFVVAVSAVAPHAQESLS